MLSIATWNVNSVNARLPNLVDWLRTKQPDIVLLQETKTVDDNFPEAQLSDLGYNIAILGQKSYNGVAILSKRPIEDITRGLPGNDTDPQARYIEAFTAGVRVASIYLPNGNPVASDKFPYKLSWMKALLNHAQTLIEFEEPIILGGDYNIIPDERDVYDVKAWEDDALCQPEARALFRTILNLGYTDAFRALHDMAGAYSFWDYQKGRWNKDEGLRIDHFLLSPEAADRLKSCEIDRHPRGKTKASDHTPVLCTLKE